MLNGASINGGRISTILAAAAIACSATISAVGTRQQDALAPSSSSAQFTAVPTLTHSAAAAGLDGSAEVYLVTEHKQAAQAATGGTCSIQAFVLRAVAGSAEIAGSANIVAIPASVLGTGALGASASLTADATKIQPGRAFAPCGAEVAFESDPVATRYAIAAPIAGSAAVRVEPWLNGVAYSYADIVAGGQLTAQSAGLVFRPAVAAIDGVATTSANATHIKPGSGSADSAGVLIVGSPHIEATMQATVDGSATVVAAPDRRVIGVSAPTGTAHISAQAKQRHGSAAAAAPGSCQFTAAGLVRRFVVAQPASGTATVGASAVRILLPQGLLGAAADVSATAVRSAIGAADFTPADAELIAAADVTYRMGFAAIDGSATADASALRIAMLRSDIAASAEVVAAPVRRLVALALVDGSADIEADTITNPDSEDPADRTFIRPVADVAFIRPPQDTLFRRAA